MIGTDAEAVYPPAKIRFSDAQIEEYMALARSWVPAIIEAASAKSTISMRLDFLPTSSYDVLFPSIVLCLIE